MEDGKKLMNKLEVLYEDNHLIVVIKPSNIFIDQENNIKSKEEIISEKEKENELNNNKLKETEEKLKNIKIISEENKIKFEEQIKNPAV